MKHVLFYTAAANVAELAPLHYPTHAERAAAYQAKGHLLMIGTFADVARDGAMAIFDDREAAEEFAAGAPFVQHKVVESYRILDWNA